MATTLRFNETLDRLPVYQPGRPIEEVARELNLPVDGIIKLASNENPLGPSPLALAAMEKHLHQLHLYPDGNAFSLKQKLAQRLGVEPGQIVLGNGSNEVLELVGHALLRPEVDVVVSQYCFAVYPIVAHLFGANLITVPARDCAHDLPAMLRAITPRTRVVFVANPNNPTGTVAPAADVMRLLTEMPSDVLLVMDEAYIEFLEEPCDLLPLLRAGRMPNLLLTRTFSKIYGLAGLRVGYGIGPTELISTLEKVREPFNVNSMAQVGALAALDDREHVTRTRKVNAEGLRFFEQACHQLGRRFLPSGGNFLLVEVGDGQRVFTEMQKLGVITRPMGAYELPEWLRISIGTAVENERCMAALERALVAIH